MSFTIRQNSVLATYSIIRDIPVADFEFLKGWFLKDFCVFDEITFIPGDKHSLNKQWTHRTMLMTVSAAARGKGAEVLERPTIERITPGRESEFDLR